MKREYTSNQDYPELILDCSFNNTIVDATGNYILTGSPNFANDPEDSSIKVLDCTADAYRLTITYAQLPPSYYINNFRLSVDFLLYSFQNPSYPNIVDSCQSGNFNGIFTQREFSYWYFGFRGSSSVDQYALQVSTSVLSINTWYNLIIDNNNLTEDIILTKKSDGTIIGRKQGATPTISGGTNTTYNRFVVGGSTKCSSRYLNWTD